jgi:hypothetical protein
LTAIKVRPSSASQRARQSKDEECNLQVLETVYLMGSSFPRKRVYQCSHWRASAYVGGPNLLTWYGIYQMGPLLPLLLAHSSYTLWLTLL